MTVSRLIEDDERRLSREASSNELTKVRDEDGFIEAQRVNHLISEEIKMLLNPTDNPNGNVIIR